MAYRKFTLSDLQDKFGIETAPAVLFETVISIAPSDLLEKTLARNKSMPFRTEKAVSEALVAPILLEIQDLNINKITLFSGENLLADRAKGLTGELDFLFLNKSHALELTAPIISITEAKLDQALVKAIHQCAAQMLGAQVFNQNHYQKNLTIYGAVTNGSQWRFLKLENKTLYTDTNEYATKNLPELLGVLQFIIDTYN